MSEEEVGVVTHYYGKIGVAGIKLTAGSLKVGDRIRIRGHTSDFEQSVDSIQIEHDQVEEAAAGQDVGIRVVEHAREHDKVLKLAD